MPAEVLICCKAGRPLVKLVVTVDSASTLAAIGARDSGLQGRLLCDIFWAV